MSPRPAGIAWWILAVLATAVGSYGLLMIDAREHTDAVPGMPWLDELHFVTGGLALIVGIWGFRRDVLVRRRGLHRALGKVYVGSVLLGGLSGAAMACFAMGGAVPRVGFGLLALGWLGTTAAGWRAIHGSRNQGGRDVAAHRRWMVRSYALTCAAITLRIQLGPLAMLLQGFEPAYRIVAWSAWVPNALFAEWWLRRHPQP
ncbi:MAG: DUF2306 domain-containing protein [Planctomycetota bacterium]